MGYRAMYENGKETNIAHQYHVLVQSLAWHSNYEYAQITM